MIDLRMLRAWLGMSQETLARQIGLDRRRISEIENGERGLRPEEAKRVRELLAARADTDPERRAISLLTGMGPDDT